MTGDDRIDQESMNQSVIVLAKSKEQAWKRLALTELQKDEGTLAQKVALLKENFCLFKIDILI